MRIDFQNAILLVLCLVLLLSVFTLSASAAESPFDSQPFSVDETVYVHYASPTNFHAVVLSSAPSDYYVFVVGGQVYVVCTEPGQIVSNDSYFNGSQNLNSYLDSALVPMYYVIHGTQSTSLELESAIPRFEQLSAGMQALSEYISSIPVTEPSTFQYSLPPGNVAYIEMGSSSAIKLSMDFPELSNSFGTPFSKANSAYALLNSLPSVGSSAASGTVIPWAKSGRLNLIGQTTVASFGPVGPIATRYIAVINPSYYDHVLVTGTYRQNPPIQIDALNVLSIKVYPLQSDFTFNNDTGQVTTTIAGDAYVGDVDSETGDIYWTDPDGGSSAPSLGGNNLPEAGNSIFDTLRNIASDFSEFLKGPVSAIRVVVSSIREFMGTFTQLYTWLPSPVYNLITSALMIALTIGVIKIFV